MDEFENSRKNIPQPIWEPFSLFENQVTDQDYGSVQDSIYHKAFFEINDNNKFEIIKEEQFDTWDSDHVRMPFSESNKINYENVLQVRWKLFQEKFQNKIKSFDDFLDKIHSLNPRFKNYWNFNILNLVIHNHPGHLDTLNKISSLALDLPNQIMRPIPLVKQGKMLSLSFTQYQISVLLANGFLCNYPRRNKTQYGSEYANYPSINFSPLLNEKKGLTNLCNTKYQKVLCILNYFNRVYDEGEKYKNSCVTFSRRNLSLKPEWAKSNKLISSSKLIVSENHRIEDHPLDTIQVDFANQYLGGGFLGHGCVQEEIMVAMKPEILVGGLFFERLSNPESLIIQGVEQFSKYSGYADTFRYEGNFVEGSDSNCIRDKYNRWRNVITVIDALIFNKVPVQHTTYYFERELNKAYCGFTDSLQPTAILPKVVVSGNWGCGAFGGSNQIKALIQLMACVEAQKDLAYCSFHDKHLKNNLLSMYKIFLDNWVTVSDLHSLILKYGKFLTKNYTDIDLFTFIKRELLEIESELVIL